MRSTGSDEAATTGGRTSAQLYCGIFGILLLVIGILGFLVNSSFETGVVVDGGQAVSRATLLGFEVNGWHNVVHIGSGLALLAAASAPSAATVGAVAFALTYLVVTVIGFIDGSDVFGIIPVNTADNVLHAAIALLGLLAVSAPARPARAVDAGPHRAARSHRPIH